MIGTVEWLRPRLHMLESMQSLHGRVDIGGRRGSRTGAAPWGTVTTLPSTVSVISPLRAEVDENDRRPIHGNKETIKAGANQNADEHTVIPTV